MKSRIVIWILTLNFIEFDVYGIYHQIFSSDYDFYRRLKLFPAVSLLYANYKRNNRYSLC